MVGRAESSALLCTSGSSPPPEDSRTVRTLDASELYNTFLRLQCGVAPKSAALVVCPPAKAN